MRISPIIKDLGFAVLSAIYIFVAICLIVANIELEETSSLYWSDFYSTVIDRETNKVDLERTNQERARRGLPVPWTKEIWKKEIWEKIK